MPHRCFFPDASTLEKGAERDLDGDEAHHLIRVLRCKVGETIELLDGKGHVAVAEITHVERRTLQIKIGEKQRVEKPTRQFTLIQAVPKGKRQDLVLQKAVELGVHRIIFVQTDHVVSRLKSGDLEDKMHRWNQILLSALKQSGNPWLPELTFAWDWAETVQTAIADHDSVLLADLSPGTRSLREVLTTQRESMHALACCIGPEGDFSPEETAIAHDAGCLPVHLGPLVLRTETAAIYLMSVFAYEFLN